MSSKTKATPAAKKPGTTKTAKIPKPKAVKDGVAVAGAETPAAVESPTTPAPAPEPLDPKNVTLGQLSDAYVRSLEERGHSPSTCKGYKGEMGLAEDALGENTPIASITVEQVQKFFKSAPVTKTRDGLPKAQLGVDKTRRVLRLALVWAVQQGWIETAPIPEPAKA